MWRDFEGGVYWDVLAEICSKISRAEGFRGAARFQGNTVTYVVIYGVIQENSLEPVRIARYVK